VFPVLVSKVRTSFLAILTGLTHKQTLFSSLSRPRAEYFILLSTPRTTTRALSTLREIGIASIYQYHRLASSPISSIQPYIDGAAQTSSPQPHISSPEHQDIIIYTSVLHIYSRSIEVLTCNQLLHILSCSSYWITALLFIYAPCSLESTL
jgi:hypothetical protein